jgi:hypothetical protein
MGTIDWHLLFATTSYVASTRAVSWTCSRDLEGAIRREKSTNPHDYQNFMASARDYGGACVPRLFAQKSTMPRKT